MAKSDTENARVSSNWNGILFTAHASNEDGTKFGTGTGGTDEEARAAALKDLAEGADTTAPEQGGDHSTAEAEAEKAGAVRAGKTGGKTGS